MSPTPDWDDLDDEQLLAEAESVIDQDRLNPRVLALIEAILQAPADSPGDDSSGDDSPSTDGTPPPNG
ncbi:hypothetical protein CLV63_10197 [Murinocardiopsis flavida]|uniref:Uncharacterized protein n=1 Tax=Murinocardiopsis flavida TaxID=645275 RepID=A0A2P8DTU5_9ACTN|nr:hypothetical protein [Murinocardiopsis flavida]PSL00623.1 hypothetical protein CLV63_10197 [Murinocardiopsis flavida]